MFDMKKHCGNGLAYQLRITYNATDNKINVIGYAKAENGMITPDGAPLYFGTLDEALEHIKNYHDKDVL